MASLGQHVHCVGMIEMPGIYTGSEPHLIAGPLFKVRCLALQLCHPVLNPAPDLPVTGQNFNQYTQRLDDICGTETGSCPFKEVYCMMNCTFFSLLTN